MSKAIIIREKVESSVKPYQDKGQFNGATKSYLCALARIIATEDLKKAKILGLMKNDKKIAK